jgi:beta-glucoside operon transcriptional antiterminator
VVIRKIWNNNVIVAINAAGEETVALGKGIAFNRKVGDSVDESVVEKFYVLTNREVVSKFQQILADIPIEHFDIAERIIDFAKTAYSKRMNDSIYVSLSDHIDAAIERCRSGIVLPNPLVHEIEQFYPDEFKVGMMALDLLKSETGCAFPIDEAGFIALHFVNAEIDGAMGDVCEIAEIIEGVGAIVRARFGPAYELHRESIAYYRFITHLKSFARRIVQKAESSGEDIELLEMVRRKFPAAFACSEDIERYIERKYGYEIGKEELAYLALNIDRATREVPASKQE